MLALGVIFTPITKVFGPVVTFNILLRLALATSAASMCFVLRRWTTWWPAAFVGGLIYGFSPYMLNFGAYLFLIFAPLPPLILLITHETFVRQKWRPGPTGIALGLLCALQFFIWVEVLAGTVLVALFAVAVILAVSRRTFPRRWRYSVTAIAYAAGVVCVLLAYPVLFTFAGPQHINGSPQSPAVLNALRGDFLSPLVSRPIEWVDPVRITAQVFTAGNVLYLGLPLIVALVCFAVFLRRRREILFAGSMALFSFILSLGSPLQIDGLNTSIPLPYGILSHLPALSGLEPRRFALYTALFAAAMFALGIDELWNRLGTQPHMLSHALEGTRERGKILGVAALALLMLIALLPMVPSSAQATRPTNVPPLFRRQLWNRYLARVLFWPIPTPTQTAALTWQAWCRFKAPSSTRRSLACASIYWEAMDGSHHLRVTVALSVPLFSSPSRCRLSSTAPSSTLRPRHGCSSPKRN